MSKAIMPYQSGLVKRLIADGVIPHECTRFSLHCDAKEPVRMEIEAWVTSEQMDKIEAAFRDHPEEAQRIVREMLLKERVGERTAEVKV